MLFSTLNFLLSDLYVLVENLRLYVESEEVQLLSNGVPSLPTGDEEMQYPVSLGLPFMDNGKVDFNTGGPGYTMNKAALKYLVTKSSSRYLARKTSAEDLMVSTILRHEANVPSIDTRDVYGQQRYHHFQVC